MQSSLKFIASLPVYPRLISIRAEFPPEYRAADAGGAELLRPGWPACGERCIQGWDQDFQQRRGYIGNAVLLTHSSSLSWSWPRNVVLML
jgi:hypothetical protein